MTDLTIEAQANLLRRILRNEADDGSRAFGWGSNMIDDETLCIDTVLTLSDDERMLVKAIQS